MERSRIRAAASQVGSDQLVLSETDCHNAPQYAENTLASFSAPVINIASALLNFKSHLGIYQHSNALISFGALYGSIRHGPGKQPLVSSMTLPLSAFTYCRTLSGNYCPHRLRNHPHPVTFSSHQNLNRKNPLSTPRCASISHIISL